MVPPDRGIGFQPVVCRRHVRQNVATVDDLNSSRFPNLWSGTRGATELSGGRKSASSSLLPVLPSLPWRPLCSISSIPSGKMEHHGRQGREGESGQPCSFPRWIGQRTAGADATRLVRCRFTPSVSRQVAQEVRSLRRDWERFAKRGKPPQDSSPFPAEFGTVNSKLLQNATPLSHPVTYSQLPLESPSCNPSVSGLSGRLRRSPRPPDHRD